MHCLRYVCLCLMANDVIAIIMVQKGLSALHLASEYGHVHVVQVLITARVHINMQDKVLYVLEIDQVLSFCLILPLPLLLLHMYLPSLPHLSPTLFVPHSPLH